MICSFCKQKIDLRSFRNEDEAYMLCPRGFLGEGWKRSGWVYLHPYGWDSLTVRRYASVCIKCDKGNIHFPKIFVDSKAARKWVKEMKK